MTEITREHEASVSLQSRSFLTVRLRGLNPGLFLCDSEVYVYVKH